MIGVDSSAVSLWETGKCKPRANLLPKLAEILEVTVDDLIEEE